MKNSPAQMSTPINAQRKEQQQIPQPPRTAYFSQHLQLDTWKLSEVRAGTMTSHVKSGIKRTSIRRIVERQKCPAKFSHKTKGKVASILQEQHRGRSSCNSNLNPNSKNFQTDQPVPLKGRPQTTSFHTKHHLPLSLEELLVGPQP